MKIKVLKKASSRKPRLLLSTFVDEPPMNKK